MLVLEVTNHHLNKDTFREQNLTKPLINSEAPKKNLCRSVSMANNNWDFAFNTEFQIPHPHILAILVSS